VISSLDRQLQLPVAVAGAILAGELDVQRAAELGILEDEVEDQHKQGSLRQRRAPSIGACQHSARQRAARVEPLPPRAPEKGKVR
jgi:hypothetical protein